jgi:hypothetical protein
MNNSCPTCGAIYNVASIDVGRKLKCKKCNAALKVTDAGLELDSGGTGTSAPAPAAAEDDPKPKKSSRADDDDDFDDEPVVKKGKGNKYARSGGNPLAAIGGVPTILFSFGVFLVIVCIAMPRIGEAANDRARAYVDKLDLDQKAKLEALMPKGKKESDLTESEKNKINEDGKKIIEDYDKLIKEAKTDAKRTEIANRRDVWFERYGLMFGFLLVSFGCIGYLRTEQPLTLRIVAAVILGAMMLAMFGAFAGCTVPR